MANHVLSQGATLPLYSQIVNPQSALCSTGINGQQQSVCGHVRNRKICGLALIRNERNIELTGNMIFRRDQTELDVRIGVRAKFLDGDLGDLLADIGKVDDHLGSTIKRYPPKIALSRCGSVPASSYNPPNKAGGTVS